MDHQERGILAGKEALEEMYNQKRQAKISVAHLFDYFQLQTQMKTRALKCIPSPQSVLIIVCLVRINA